MDKKIRTELAIGILLLVAIITGGYFWSEQFGANNPQTGLQHVASLVSHEKSETIMIDSIVFLGDSITAREDWNVLFRVAYIKNAGISGNTTDDILARLIPVLNSKPKKIFLMVGINDLIRNKNIPDVVANYKIILGKIKTESPDTVVYVQSVLPINNDISKYGKVDSQKIISLNNELSLLAKKNGEHFIDLYPYFCGSDNKLYAKYTADGVHPNANGYAVWKNLIIPYVK